MKDLTKPQRCGGWKRQLLCHNCTFAALYYAVLTVSTSNYLVYLYLSIAQYCMAMSVAIHSVTQFIYHSETDLHRGISFVGTALFISLAIYYKL